MSNYRRLISYIYAYEGGVKGKNVGFAKLEVRNGQCKIQVNVRNVYIGNQDTGVYLLSGTDEILVGKIFIRNGAGEFRTVAPVNNIAGSGQSLERCFGLTVHGLGDSWRCYTTIWEDAVSHAAASALEEATSEQAEKKEMEDLPESEISAAKLEYVVESHQNSITETVEAEIEAQSRQAQPAKEIAQSPEALSVISEPPSQPEPPSVIPEASAALVESEEPSPAKAASIPSDSAGALKEPERAESGTEQKTEAEKRKAEKGQDEKSQAEKGQDEKSQAERGQDEKRQAERGQDDKGQPGQGVPNGPAQTDDKAQSLQSGQPEQERMEEEPKMDMIWQQFFKRYPKIQAFDYNGGCEILTIKPQDIGLLPRETWGYGNNSFLLHGYYNHRYLIFARLNSPKGRPRYLLGVPGHYYSNEKYMAAMFGFPNFVLSKIQPAGDGRFGYWYTDVRIGA